MQTNCNKNKIKKRIIFNNETQMKSAAKIHRKTIKHPQCRYNMLKLNIITTPG